MASTVSFVESLVYALTPDGDRFVAGNRKHPRGNLTATRKSAGLLPNLKEHFA
jgi:hypothetical protein